MEVGGGEGKTNPHYISKLGINFSPFSALFFINLSEFFLV